jgi:hypothetical protein
MAEPMAEAMEGDLCSVAPRLDDSLRADDDFDEDQAAVGGLDTDHPALAFIPADGGRAGDGDEVRGVRRELVARALARGFEHALLLAPGSFVIAMFGLVAFSASAVARAVARVVSAQYGRAV